MKFIATLLTIISLSCIHAQTVADLENLGIVLDDYDNGSDLSGGWQSGHVFFPNNFNETYASWTGWAISATTDSQTPGFYNQYSAIPGEGVDASTSYAVRYDFQPSVLRLTSEAASGVVEGMYITNSTYAYLSMRDGDSFAKRFGGELGDDPDWFKLTIKKYLDGELSMDSVDFYLADYRSENNDEDYLIDEWTWVDLSSLGNCDSLWFGLTSTDNGQFGMNTPAYFCVDDVTTRDASTALLAAPKTVDLDIYPNPTSALIRFEGTADMNRATLLGMNGHIMDRHIVRNGTNTLDIADLPSGNYVLFIETGDIPYTARISKQ